MSIDKRKGEIRFLGGSSYAGAMHKSPICYLIRNDIAYCKNEYGKIAIPIMGKAKEVKYFYVGKEVKFEFNEVA